MKDNPVGVRGGRALCKALLVLSAHGVTVDLDGCNLGCSVESMKLFDPGNPNGPYQLKVDDPYDRMVAYELVELAWVEEGENWQDEMMDGKKYELQVRCPPHGLSYNTMALAATRCNAMRSL